jgi:hypothetical protein
MDIAEQPWVTWSLPCVLTTAVVQGIPPWLSARSVRMSRPPSTPALPLREWASWLGVRPRGWRWFQRAVSSAVPSSSPARTSRQGRPAWSRGPARTAAAAASTIAPAAASREAAAVE